MYLISTGKSRTIAHLFDSARVCNQIFLATTDCTHGSSPNCEAQVSAIMPDSAHGAEIVQRYKMFAPVRGVTQLTIGHAYASRSGTDHSTAGIAVPIARVLGQAGNHTAESIIRSICNNSYILQRRLKLLLTSRRYNV